jgi:dethiobiotin synthetase
MTMKSAFIAATMNPTGQATKQNSILTRLDPQASAPHLSGMNYFITGTDTNAGKTYATCLMLEELRRQGIDAVGYKPVSCGDRDDATRLAAASGGLAIDEINPLHLNTPVAPLVAGMLENHLVDPQILIDGYHQLAAKHTQVLVEGAGGWEVPIAPNFRVSDFAKALNLPVILVVANRLGALNHTLLSVDAIRAKGLQCAGIILNQLDDELDTAMITNKGLIEELTCLPLIDHLIHQQNFINLDALENIESRNS